MENRRQNPEKNHQKIRVYRLVRNRTYYKFIIHLKHEKDFFSVLLSDWSLLSWALLSDSFLELASGSEVVMSSPSRAVQTDAQPSYL
jgi:hypothetical protein